MSPSAAVKNFPATRRRNTRFLAVALAASITTCGAAAEPVRIICIGDSITQGGRTGREEFTYRWPLFVMLKKSGINFDFIGSRQEGLDRDVKWPVAYKGASFDADHEGYYGAKTATVRDKLRAVLPGLPVPDIALIHLGTNDQHAKNHTAAVVKPLKDIIKQLRAKNPKVVILVGHLNFNDGEALKIRPLVEKMATGMNTQQSPVVTVHHYKGWNEKPEAKTTDTFDWAHPNPKGQRKMAKAWFDAMKPYLPGSTTSGPSR